uniref:WSC domain-containing protein 1-like n=1 Tax=Ciona intestinalis TaxID=7719 RepID=UPI00089DCD41|nr:WSC domain-containing protein 1-like [Ciona intestinalis]|eukprot:XP_002120962.3 WSC domain-containing protein 1-like [Ciona intestinalis]
MSLIKRKVLSVLFLTLLCLVFMVDLNLYAVQYSVTFNAYLPKKHLNLHDFDLINIRSVPDTDLAFNPEFANISCKYESIGCFNSTAFSVLEMPVKTFSARSVWKCVFMCSQIEHMYAVFNGVSSCICGHEIRHDLIFNSDTSFLSNCSRNDTSAYKLTNKCRSINFSHVELNTLKYSPSSSTKHLPKLQLFSMQCMLYCEQNQSMYSVVNSTALKCFCADSIYLSNGFRARNRLQNIANLIRTNVQNPVCSKKHFLHSQNKTDLTGLISFPGSGNTWIRHLLEQATGLYTGSIYSDEHLYRKGFLGEIEKWQLKKCAIIKSHKETLQFSSHFDKLILVIRNPFDAILSEFNRCLSDSHTGFANQSSFTGKKWPKFVPYKMQKWIRIIKVHLEARKETTVVFYENLVQNPIPELRRVVKFTGLHIPNLEARLICTQENLNGAFQRPKRKQNPYSNWMVTLINDGITEVRKVLKEFGYDCPEYERYV